MCVGWVLLLSPEAGLEVGLHNQQRKTKISVVPDGVGLSNQLLRALRQEGCKFKACLGHTEPKLAWPTQILY